MCACPSKLLMKMNLGQHRSTSAKEMAGSGDEDEGTLAWRVQKVIKLKIGSKEKK